VLAFDMLVYRIAGQTFRTSQLDKGVKVIELTKARSSDAMRERRARSDATIKLIGGDLAGHFAELMQCGLLSLFEAANRYDGSRRFATYAEWWVKKFCLEYVRQNWNVVKLPEPPEWKVAKEEQLPKTVPTPQFNPFENPLSLDKRATPGREKHIPLNLPSEDDDFGSPEERCIGRYNEGIADYEKPDESRAHDSMEALERILKWESIDRTNDARISRMDHRSRFIIGLRFPPANTERQARDKIGAVLGISAERVRQIEHEITAELAAGEPTPICLDEFWCSPPYWNTASLGRLSRALIRRAPLTRENVDPIDRLVGLMFAAMRAPDQEPEPTWVDRLVALIPQCFQKRWQAPKILYEEEIARIICLDRKVLAQINAQRKAASSDNYYRQIGWDEERRELGRRRFQQLLTRGYRGNCPRR
jgi:RNA polymerase sigma factor (sigma-70 family)